MIISVTSLKGGVGKSTIAQNLAVCLSHTGYKVCIVDADTNQSSLRWSSFREDDLPGVPVYGIPDGKMLSSNVKHLNDDYDIVVIDGTPSLSKVTSKILLLGDIIIVPILPSGLDIWATEQFMERYEDAKDQKERDIPAYFLLNQFNGKINLNKEVKDVLGDLNIKTLDNSLKSRVAYKQAVIEGLGVFEYKDLKAKNEIIQVTNEIKEIITNL